VKITLIGQLGTFVDKGTCVMQHTGEKVPALPKGVPVPPAVKTNYVVYIGDKQWKNVAATVNDPEDALIIEGFPQIDARLGRDLRLCQQCVLEEVAGGKETTRIALEHCVQGDRGNNRAS
jgi:hypothetical protein